MRLRDKNRFVTLEIASDNKDINIACVNIIQKPRLEAVYCCIN